MERLDDVDTTVGNFRLIAGIAQGAMGQVFLGCAPDGRMAAVKRIRPELLNEPELRERFRREVDASRQIRASAHTAMVIDADTRGENPWLATEFIPGRSLRDLLRRQQTLPVHSVLHLASELAKALTVIHDAELVHRDLKPSNVILTATGAKVIDLGIARAANTPSGKDLTKTGWIIGTAAFMSPEQAESRRVDVSSDVFSLGSVLAAAYTGKGPFDAGSDLQTIYRVAHGQPALDGIPTRLRTIIKRCLRKNPNQRPSPEQLLELIGDVPVHARPWPLGIYRLIDEQLNALNECLGGLPDESTVYHGVYDTVRRAVNQSAETQVLKPVHVPQPKLSESSKDAHPKVVKGKSGGSRSSSSSKSQLDKGPVPGGNGNSGGASDGKTGPESSSSSKSQVDKGGTSGDKSKSVKSVETKQPARSSSSHSKSKAGADAPPHGGAKNASSTPDSSHSKGEAPNATDSGSGPPKTRQPQKSNDSGGIGGTVVVVILVALFIWFKTSDGETESSGSNDAASQGTSVDDEVDSIDEELEADSDSEPEPEPEPEPESEPETEVDVSELPDPCSTPSSTTLTTLGLGAGEPESPTGTEVSCLWNPDPASPQPAVEAARLVLSTESGDLDAQYETDNDASQLNVGGQDVWEVIEPDGCFLQWETSWGNGGVATSDQSCQLAEQFGEDVVPQL